jgi:hypothetical protein
MGQGWNGGDVVTAIPSKRYWCILLWKSDLALGKIEKTIERYTTPLSRLPDFLRYVNKIHPSFRVC